MTGGLHMVCHHNLDAKNVIAKGDQSVAYYQNIILQFECISNPHF